MTENFSFNLWSEPWITVELIQGGTETLGLEAVLLRAHEFVFIADDSPLVIAGIHRLGTAILQDMYNPQKTSDLRAIHKAGKFDANRIQKFKQDYAYRFDIFSVDAPFLQSADASMTPSQDSKSIAYLAPDIPSGTNVTHFKHGSQKDQAFSPAFAAKGLVCIPAFATSGGAGIKPSINGVPPIYVLPMGNSLFESFASSLVTPNFQPAQVSVELDRVWWRREPIVKRSEEVDEVGYLHSLTFPARRVRLQPEFISGTCTGSGAHSDTLVRSMIFEMGESRVKGSFLWRDPFVSYRIPKNKDPLPVRPIAGKAMWREYASLFLSEVAENPRAEKHLRPRILEQIANVQSDAADQLVAFRCIGMRTDMKAKIYEWIDASFSVSLTAILSEDAGIAVQDALTFANDAEYVIKSVYRKSFDERFLSLVPGMLERYWQELATPFRDLVNQAATPEWRTPAGEHWRNTVLEIAMRTFHDTIDQLGTKGADLRRRTQAESSCQSFLHKKLREYQVSVPGGV